MDRNTEIRFCYILDNNTTFGAYHDRAEQFADLVKYAPPSTVIIGHGVLWPDKEKQTVAEFIKNKPHPILTSGAMYNVRGKTGECVFVSSHPHDGALLIFEHMDSGRFFGAERDQVIIQEESTHAAD